jgi:hypothetical protein
MEEIAYRSLGKRDIFQCVVSRLPTCDAVALMSTCKRLKALGIEWLRLRGRPWLPEVNRDWKCSELWLAALWAFGSPKCVLNEALEAETTADVSSRCVWKATSYGVVIHRACEIASKKPPKTVIKYPGGIDLGRRNLTIYQCGDQSIAVVNVERWLALVPEKAPRWIPLCDEAAYFAIDSHDRAKWIALLLKDRKGYVVKWSKLDKVVDEGLAIWKSARIPDRITKIFGLALRFPDPDMLALVLRAWKPYEVMRLDLKAGEWFEPPIERHDDLHQAREGVVRIGDWALYRFVRHYDSFALRLNDRSFEPVVRTYLSSQNMLRMDLEKVRTLRTDDSPLVFYQYRDLEQRRHVVAFILERPTDPPDLDGAIRAGAHIEELRKLVPKMVEGYRSDLNSSQYLQQTNAGRIAQSRPVDERFQRLITQAIHARRPEVVELLISAFVSSSNAPLPLFDLGNSFCIACALGRTRCALALLKSGYLSTAIPRARDIWTTPGMRVERWPLADGLRLALAHRHWKIATGVLELLREPTADNNLARVAILDWFNTSCQQDVGGNVAEARELLCRLIAQQPRILRADETIELANRLDLWRQDWGGLIIPMDLSAKWNSDQQRWELACQKQQSICWKLIVELRAGRRYKELEMLITRWLELPLFHGTRVALQSLLKLNPAAGKRRKLRR